MKTRNNNNGGDIYITQATQKFALANQKISEGKPDEAYALFEEVRTVMDHAFFNTKAIQYLIMSAEAVKGTAILNLRMGKVKDALAKVNQAIATLDTVKNEQTEKGLSLYYAEMYFHRTEVTAQMSAIEKEDEPRTALLNEVIADAQRAIDLLVQVNGYGTNINCLRLLQGSYQQIGNANAVLKNHEASAEAFKNALDYCGTIINMQPESKFTAVRAGNSMRLALEMTAFNENRDEIIAYANRGLQEYTALYNKKKNNETAFNLGAGCYNMALITEKFEDYPAAKSYCDKAISYQASVCEAEKYRAPQVYRLLVYFATAFRMMDKMEGITEDVKNRYREDFEKVKEIYKKVTGADFKEVKSE